MSILVTGGTGMVGSNFSNDKDVTIVGSEVDLRDQEQCLQLFSDLQPESVVHLAAKVGGVKANHENLGSFFYDNILINTNVLESARVTKVKKVVSLLSTCVYPAATTYPLVEDQIHSGPPHYTNFAYAHAKRMLDVQSRAYRQQYGCNFITAIPNNLFGENDNFHLEDSHVIPAIIRKMYEAKITGKDVKLWGDGSPLREFTYSKDIKDILQFLLETYNGAAPINIGNTSEVSIKYVAETISEILDFDGKIIWDTTEIKGQYRKPSDNSKLLSLGWKTESYTNIKEALINVCKWFIINYPNIRGFNDDKK